MPTNLIKLVFAILIFVSAIIGQPVIACSSDEEQADYHHLIKSEQLATSTSLSIANNEQLEWSIYLNAADIVVTATTAEYGLSIHNCSCWDCGQCDNCSGVSGGSSLVIPVSFTGRTPNFYPGGQFSQYHNLFLSLPPTPLDHRPKRL